MLLLLPPGAASCCARPLKAGCGPLSCKRLKATELCGNCRSCSLQDKKHAGIVAGSTNTRAGCVLPFVDDEHKITRQRLHPLSSTIQIHRPYSKQPIASWVSRHKSTPCVIACMLGRGRTKGAVMLKAQQVTPTTPADRQGPHQMSLL